MKKDNREALVNQQMIREYNLKRIYQLIGKGKDISRASLAQKTGLSKTTVSSLVDELTGNHYVVDCGTVENLKTGRNPSILKVDSRYNRIAVISWHSSWLDLAAVNTAGDIAFRSRVPLEAGADGAGAICSAFDRILLPQLEKYRVLGVCIILPGIIDAENKTVLSTVVGITKQDPVIERFRSHFSGYSLSLVNDTACLAYAEVTFTHIQEPAFAYINMDKGVGACLFESGKMLRGAGGMATQFGHCSIERGGISCSCGNRGCLEQMVGETVLPRRAAECGLRAAQGKKQELTFSDLAALADGGNPAAEKTREALAADLAYGLSNLISVFHPSLIVIGGSGVHMGQKFLDGIRAGLLRDGFRQFVEGVRVQYAALGQDADIKGAAQYFMDFHYSFLMQETNQLYLT